MNNKVKRMPGDFDGFGWQYKAVVPVFAVVLALHRLRAQGEPVAKPLFDNVRTEENVKNALQGVYKNPSRVDDALVSSITDAAKREGAFRAFVRILTGPPGPRPEEMMDAVTCPMLILWGDEDGITPMDFPLGQYFIKLPATPRKHHPEGVPRGRTLSARRQPARRDPGDSRLGSATPSAMPARRLFSYIEIGYSTSTIVWHAFVKDICYR